MVSYAPIIVPEISFLVLLKTISNVNGKKILNPNPKNVIAIANSIIFSTKNDNPNPAAMEKVAKINVRLVFLASLLAIMRVIILDNPKIKNNIKQIVFMGGVGMSLGNITPVAEFNIYVDPHAADIVLNSGIPLVMMGLDVTHKVMVNDEIIEDFKKNENKSSYFFADLMKFYSKFHRKLYEIDETPLHDPCVIAYLINSSLFKGKFVNVEVEKNSELTRGKTVVDWWGVTNKKANCYVMIEADHKQFFYLLSTELKKLN